MDGGSVAILATSFFGFLTTISTLIYQGYSRSRDRRWDQQDRALAALADADHRQTLMDKLKENTDVTKDAGLKADAAYKEANQVNMKLAAIGERRLSDEDKPH